MWSLASHSVSQHMYVELPRAPGASVFCSPVPAFGGGGKKGEHGKVLRHCSSSNSGKRGAGALAPGGTLGSKSPGGSSPERHG